MYRSKPIIGSTGCIPDFFCAPSVSASRARIRWHRRHKRGFGKSRPQLLVGPAWDQAPKTNCEVAIHLTPSEYLRRDRVAACALYPCAVAICFLGLLAFPPKDACLIGLGFGKHNLFFCSNELAKQLLISGIGGAGDCSDRRLVFCGLFLFNSGRAIHRGPRKLHRGARKRVSVDVA